MAQRVLSASFPNWSLELLARQEQRACARVREQDRALRKLGSSEQNLARLDRKAQTSARGGAHAHGWMPHGHDAAPARESVVLLTDTVHSRQVVVRCSAHAQHAGVRAGQSVAEAQALLVGHPVRCVPFDPQRDQTALRALAAWARRFSPRVAEAPPDGLLLDIGGCERVFGGEERLLTMFVQSVSGLGITVHAAAADTVGCAWAVARYGTRAVDGSATRVPSGEERAALAPLPVAALRLEAPACRKLFEVGIERVEHLFSLARTQLFSRFGADVLLRLDQATGHAFEAIAAIEFEDVPEIERVFQGPVKDLVLLFDVVREMTEELIALLKTREVGARRIDLLIERVDAPALRRTVVLTRPTLDAAHLWALLRPKVEAANLGYGIERLALTASQVAVLAHRQAAMLLDDAVAQGPPALGAGSSSLEGYDLDREAGVLLDVLVERCGHDRVLQADRVASHIPEHAIRARSVLEPPPAKKRTSKKTDDEGRTRTQRVDRPSVLFEQPDPIDMIVVRSDGSPAWMRWRGTECRVLSVQGPERIGAPWWRATARPPRSKRRPRHRSEGRAAFDRKRRAEEERDVLVRCLAHRDYYKVQDDRGRWLWVFHGLDSRQWYIHGHWS